MCVCVRACVCVRVYAHVISIFTYSVRCFRCKYTSETFHQSTKMCSGRAKYLRSVHFLFFFYGRKIEYRHRVINRWELELAAEQPVDYRGLGYRDSTARCADPSEPYVSASPSGAVVTLL